MDICIEWSTVEFHAAAILDGKVSVYDVMEVESVFTAGNVVLAVHVKRTFVVVLSVYDSISIGAYETILRIVHSHLYLRFRS